MKKTIKDIDVKGKKVIVRCDFNVPQKDGAITDDNRIVSAANHHLFSREGGKGYFDVPPGRPKGEPKMEFTLEPVADRLFQLLEKKSNSKAAQR